MIYGTGSQLMEQNIIDGFYEFSNHDISNISDFSKPEPKLELSISNEM